MSKKKMLLPALALWAATSVHAGDRLFVQVPAVIDPSAPINAAVRSECRVEGLVGQHVFSQLAQRWPDTQSVATAGEAGRGRLLRLTLVSVMGVGGGAWSGPKSMTVRAELTQGGKTLQSTVLTRSSTGGFMGGMSGTCPIMERIAVALARDVAGWMPYATRTGGAAQAPAAAAPSADLPAAPTAP